MRCARSGSRRERAGRTGAPVLRRPSLLLERAWSGAPGTVPWTRALAPLAWAYAAASARAQGRAAARRSHARGAYVIAVGGLTVGGSGKTSVARWLAARVSSWGRAAILLRGYGSAGSHDRDGRGAELVPDFEGLPPAPRVARYGDDALAHRLALPRSAAVVVCADRREGARAAIDGFGARALVLDDGWEQDGLRWNELWVVLDPERPAGNGALLPAGPLRRPAASLREATRLVLVLEEDEAVPEATRAWASRLAPGAPLLALRRTALGVSPPGRREVEPLPRAGSAGLLSGVGSPDRFERFVRAQGLDVRGHATFRNHASWRRRELGLALDDLVRAGSAFVLLTEKDEPRWPPGLGSPLPVRVLRTALTPLLPPDAALAPLRDAVAGGAAFG